MAIDSESMQMELFDVRPLTGYEGEIGRITEQVDEEFQSVGLDVNCDRPEVYEANLPTTYQQAFNWDKDGNLILGWIPVGQVYGAYDPETGRHYIDTSVTGSDVDKRRALEETGIPVSSFEEVFGHEYRHRAEDKSGIMKLYEQVAERAKEIGIDAKKAVVAFIEGLTQYLTVKKSQGKVRQDYEGPYIRETRAMVETVREYGQPRVMNPRVGEASGIFRTFMNYLVGMYNGPRGPLSDSAGAA